MRQNIYLWLQFYRCLQWCIFAYLIRMNKDNSETGISITHVLGTGTEEWDFCFAAPRFATGVAGTWRLQWSRAGFLRRSAMGAIFSLAGLPFMRDLRKCRDKKDLLYFCDMSHMSTHRYSDTYPPFGFFDLKLCAERNHGERETWGWAGRHNGEPWAWKNGREGWGVFLFEQLLITSSPHNWFLSK